jgi:hypothetical protein
LRGVFSNPDSKLFPGPNFALGTWTWNLELRRGISILHFLHPWTILDTIDKPTKWHNPGKFEREMY